MHTAFAADAEEKPPCADVLHTAPPARFALFRAFEPPQPYDTAVFAAAACAASFIVFARQPSPRRRSSVTIAAVLLTLIYAFATDREPPPFSAQQFLRADS
jgi:hypothetical protein